jgi:hypothetical protein
LSSSSFVVPEKGDEQKERDNTREESATHTHTRFAEKLHQDPLAPQKRIGISGEKKKDCAT